MLEYLKNIEADDQDLTNAWSKDNSATRTLCHGAMYEVEWNALKKPGKVPADQACSHLMKASPIAVGTTLMDAIMAYVSGHSESSVGDVHKLEMDFLKLQTLLLDRDEGVEPQRRAANVLSNLNFQRQDGGQKYFLSNPQDGNKTAKPEGTYETTETELTNLSLMNEKQRQIDTLSRSLRKRQWDLFALWWELLTDVNAAATSGQYKRRREDRIYAIMQIYNLCVGKSARPAENPSAEALVTEFAGAINRRSANLGQFFLHITQPKPGYTWQIAQNSTVPDPFMMCQHPHDMATIESDLSGNCIAAGKCCQLPPSTQRSRKHETSFHRG